MFKVPLSRIGILISNPIAAHLSLLHLTVYSTKLISARLAYSLVHVRQYQVIGVKAKIHRLVSKLKSVTRITCPALL